MSERLTREQIREMPPGRDMDVAVSIARGAPEIVWEEDRDGRPTPLIRWGFWDHVFEPVPAWSIDTDQAFIAFEDMPPPPADDPTIPPHREHCLAVVRHDDGRHIAGWLLFSDNGPARWYGAWMGVAGTRPLAICRAVLLALSKEPT